MFSATPLLLMQLLAMVPVLLAAAQSAPVLWKSAQQLTMINAGPWPVSEEQTGGMLRRLPYAAKGVVRHTIYDGSEDTAGLVSNHLTLICIDLGLCSNGNHTVTGYLSDLTFHSEHVPCDSSIGPRKKAQGPPDWS